MSEQYRYPPNVRTVQISPKCQDSTDIPQMSEQYRYPPNVRTVQISPKCQEQDRYPPNVRTVQISSKCREIRKTFNELILRKCPLPEDADPAQRSPFSHR
ncbi:unnamed protein product, partial [Staurois parvus]